MAFFITFGMITDSVDQMLAGMQLYTETGSSKIVLPGYLANQQHKIHDDSIRTCLLDSQTLSWLFNEWAVQSCEVEDSLTESEMF